MTTLRLPQTQSRIAVAKGQIVLDAALHAGVPFPHSCRSGRCGACKSRLLSGEVTMLQHSPFALDA
jgi:ferredoxin